MPCGSMPERDGKDHGEDIPKQACSCRWFARHSQLATSGANLYSPAGRVFVVVACRCGHGLDFWHRLII